MASRSSPRDYRILADMMPASSFVALRWRESFERTFPNAPSATDADSTEYRRSLANLFTLELWGTFEGKPLDASASMVEVLDLTPLAETIAYMAYRDAQGFRVKNDTPARTRALLAALLRWTDALANAARWNRSIAEVAPRVRAALTGKAYRPAPMWNHWPAPTIGCDRRPPRNGLR